MGVLSGPEVVDASRHEGPRNIATPSTDPHPIWKRIGVSVVKMRAPRFHATPSSRLH